MATFQGIMKCAYYGLNTVVHPHLKGAHEGLHHSCTISFAFLSCSALASIDDRLIHTAPNQVYNIGLLQSEIDNEEDNLVYDYID